jgi:soluble lytic murein transglycosylase-like protein
MNRKLSNLLLSGAVLLTTGISGGNVEKTKPYYVHYIYDGYDQREMAFMEQKVNKSLRKIANPAAIDVVNRYRELINKNARKYHVPASISEAVAGIENGGGIAKTSNAGAVGIYQLMGPIAKEYGLIVRDKKGRIRDMRKIPDANIAAGNRYLWNLYKRFGRWDLALQAYNIGPTKMAGLIKSYLDHTKPNWEKIGSRIDYDEVKKYNVKLVDIFELIENDKGYRAIAERKGFENGGKEYVPKICAMERVLRNQNKYLRRLAKRQIYEK